MDKVLLKKEKVIMSKVIVSGSFSHAMPVLDFLTLEVGTHRLCLNVGKELPLCTA
jgi:hypothetical protein